MNERVLIDSSALIAYFIKQEKHHQIIREFIDENPDMEWVIVSTVFSELVTWLRDRTNSTQTTSIGEFLKRSCTYIVLSEIQDENTWNNFKKFSDKDWSYTDCSLLTLSLSLNIPFILTLDHHFNQMKKMGVIPLPG
jgi:predicted nucleic acid-binding protein